MPDLLKNKNEIILDFQTLRSNPNTIPIDCVLIYKKLLNQLIGHYKTVINDILLNCTNLTLPIETNILENYLVGFKFEYQPFVSLNPSKEGSFDYLQEEGKVIIKYNSFSTINRQRFTKVHEIFHFVQRLDPQFLNFIDDLVLNSNLPPIVITKLIERSADKATSMYLMPENYFYNKYKDLAVRNENFGETSLKELAQTFMVCPKTAFIRLKEIGILVPQLQTIYQ